MTISNWLREAAHKLYKAGIESTRLDSELILSHTLRKPRTYLHAHPEEVISSRHLEIANARVDLRLDRVPVAYIIGHKEFYGYSFKVTTATLIPRPESEALIETLKEVLKNSPLKDKKPVKLVDVGTGTGCLGITAKLDLKDKIDVTLLDISQATLDVAQFNANQHSANVRLIKSDLLSSYPYKIDVILANLPYVDTGWDRSPETNYEPAKALFAADGGKALIKRLIFQAKKSLNLGGYLILELHPSQQAEIIKYAKDNGFESSKKTDFCLVLKKAPSVYR